MEKAILKILSRTDANNLPVLPRILLDLMAEFRQDELNVDKLVKVIKQDASLSASILAISKTPSYRQWRDVTDLKTLILVRGLNSVKSLLMAKAIQQFFAKIPQAQQFQIEIIWYRSLTCAFLARHLAQLTSYEFPDEAYLAGLLHRIGQLVLLQCFPKEYPDFLSAHLSDEHHEAEQERFGAPHYEIAAHLIRHWQLQSFIADAVLYQTAPVESIVDNVNLVKIVNLACHLSNICEANKYQAYATASSLLGLNQSMVESILLAVKPLVDSTAEDLGINLTKVDDRIRNVITVEHRDEIQASLGNQVKYTAFKALITEPLRASEELEQLVATIRRDMGVLFGFQAVAFFIYDGENNALNGLSGDQDGESLWTSFSIHVDVDSNLLAKTWHKKRILHSFNIDKNDATRVVDRQICQLLNSEDMLVIPLVHEDEVLGLLVTGIKRAEVYRIKSNLDFIRLFVGEAARFFKGLQHSDTELPQQDNTVDVDYSLVARKLGHEINNPLSIINNYLYLLGLKLGKDHSGEIKIIQEEIDRVGNITLSLSDFSSQSLNIANDRINLNTLITDLTKLFEMGVFKTHAIKAQLNLQTEAINMAVDKDKIKQILTNIIKNAVEAMPSGGLISIATKITKNAANEDFVEIQIQDNGPGIADEMKRQLFSPIKSSKGKHYAGLGLTICKNLVDELKGKIRCDSSHAGTTFYINLPCNF